MSVFEETSEQTQQSGHIIFKRNVRHNCILLEVSNNHSNDIKLHKILFWYPVSHIIGIDLKDVSYFTNISMIFLSF